MTHARRSLSSRDVCLLIIGAFFTCTLTFVLTLNQATDVITIDLNALPWFHQSAAVNVDVLAPSISTKGPKHENYQDILSSDLLPETALVSHAPGWTVFRNLYMHNGTLLVVTPDRSAFPETRMMTSTGLPAEDTAENKATREPTTYDMDFLTPADAMTRWGTSTKGEYHRVMTVQGISVLVNEPRQFIDHYYHYFAELLFGAWSFLSGTFSGSAIFARSDGDVYPSSFSPADLNRVIFVHAGADEWRDRPGFNAYLTHAVFPSISLEFREDWHDRTELTLNLLEERAWYFPLALLTDRSASFRGTICGEKTGRMASEAWEYMINHEAIDLAGNWWSPVRNAVWHVSGVPSNLIETERQNNNCKIGNGVDTPADDVQRTLPYPEDVVITYIDRQGSRRRLIDADHDLLVKSLEDLVARKHDEGKVWELNIVRAETLTRDEQVQLAARTTILLGVHGNGLTHLTLMKPSRVSTVVEIFFPGGYARDYSWTARALGIKHYGVWNDKYMTFPDDPPTSYPEGFQGKNIPVHGPSVAKLIEDRLEERL